MNKHEKIKQDVLSGVADANIQLEDLCKLMVFLGFRERYGKGSHRIYTMPGIFGVANLQPDENGKAKKYQVRQVRYLIVSNSL